MLEYLRPNSYIKKLFKIRLKVNLLLEKMRTLNIIILHLFKIYLKYIKCRPNVIYI